MQAFDRVLAARAKDRPGSPDFVANIFDDFTELRGDRRYGDDKAILAGIASLDGMPVTVVATQKGTDTAGRVAANFGCAHPEGYRKALRQFHLAEKFSRPVVTLIDTAGAYCGLGAEERGQAQAIAECLTTLMTLRTPVIALLTGEGGSGGALALAVADRVWMMENAVYSVISPEGCASILWKDASKTEDAARSLKLTAEDLHHFGIVESIVPEGAGFDAAYTDIKARLKETFTALKALPIEELLQHRYRRYRTMGGFQE